MAVSRCAGVVALGGFSPSLHLYLVLASHPGQVTTQTSFREEVTQPLPLVPTGSSKLSLKGYDAVMTNL